MPLPQSTSSPALPPTLSPHIRPAGVADCAAMVAIYNHYVLTDTCTYRTDPETVAEREAWLRAHEGKHPVLVAEVEGEVVGWASLSPFHSRCGYRQTVEDSVYLAPAWRGRGIGAILLKGLIAAAESAGHHRIIASISADQPGSIALHAKFGFRTVGRMSEVGRKFGRWLDLIYMEKRIAAPTTEIMPGDSGADRPAGNAARATMDSPLAVEIVRLQGEALETALPALVEVLVDVVDGGASVGFVTPMDPGEAVTYWQGVAERVAAKEIVLLGAKAEGRWVATVQLSLCLRPNGRHRAEVAKLLCRRDARGRGIGRSLMMAVEEEARLAGRTLLVLDTVTGTPAEGLYRSLGYSLAGEIPNYVVHPEGPLPTSVFWKELAAAEPLVAVGDAVGPQSRQAVMLHETRPAPIMVKGGGSWLWDADGRRYLDFVQGWAVNAFGHSPPLLRQALSEQGDRLVNSSPAYLNDAQVKLCCELAEAAGLAQVFLASSGAEANEGAVKLARKWGKLHRGGAFEIVTTTGSFHGRTLATMAASGKSGWDQLFMPGMPGFVKVAYGDAGAIEAAVGPQTAAVMVEPIQGEGGVVVPPSGYLRELRRITQERGVLLIFDEIQTGMGRTGDLFGWQAEGVRPDVMTLGKGLGAGVPLAALLASREASCFSPGEQGGTYSGTALISAVGLAVLARVRTPELLGSVRARGGELEAGLRALAARWGCPEVRGRGLLWALVLPQAWGEAIVARARTDEALLLNAPRPQLLRFMPALTVTSDEIATMLARLESVLAAVAQGSETPAATQVGRTP